MKPTAERRRTRMKMFAFSFEYHVIILLTFSAGRQTNGNERNSSLLLVARERIQLQKIENDNQLKLLDTPLFESFEILVYWSCIFLPLCSFLRKSEQKTVGRQPNENQKYHRKHIEIALDLFTETNGLFLPIFKLIHLLTSNTIFRSHSSSF